MIVLTEFLMASSYLRLGGRKEIYPARAAASLPSGLKGPCLAHGALERAGEWASVDSLVDGSIGRAGSKLAGRKFLDLAHKCAALAAEQESAQYEVPVLAE